MPWMIPENKLDDQQRIFLEQRRFADGNIWIKGFPGSGKSVLLAYTLKHIRLREKSASVAVIGFTRSLVQMLREAIDEMGLDAVVMTFYEFMDSSCYFDYILCDEVQDFVPSVLNAMRSRGGRVIVAGDENQSIYESDPKYHEKTVSPQEIGSLLACRTHELTRIHRLSSSIISAIQRLMPDMDIFHGKRDMTRSSTQIRLGSANTPKDEVKYIMREGSKATKVCETAAVLAPSNQDIILFANFALEAEGKPAWEIKLGRWHKPDYSDLNAYLDSAGVNLKYVGGGVGSYDANDHKIIIMTYFGAKGLDFDNVFLPFMSRDMIINRDESRARTLLMVAMTRSRNNLVLTYSDSKHAYLDIFADQCHEIRINDALANSGYSSAGISDNAFGI